MHRNGIISTSSVQSVVTIILSVIDFLQNFQNFGDLTTLWLIFGHIFTARAETATETSYNSDNNAVFTYPDFL